MLKMNLFLREPEIISMIFPFLSFHGILFVDTFREICNSLLVTVLLMFPMCECYSDNYEKSYMIFVWQYVSTFSDTFDKITFLKTSILEISLECIQYNWNNTNMDYPYMHSPSQCEICWQSKTGFNWVRQFTTLSSESSIDPSIGKWAVKETSYSSRQRLPEVSRLNECFCSNVCLL